MGSKRREDFRESFHQVEFDQRWIRPWTASTTAADLIKMGAPPVCYVISRLAEKDEQEWTLDAALDYFRGADEASYISCLPGKLALFAGFKTNYILSR